MKFPFLLLPLVTATALFAQAPSTTFSNQPALTLAQKSVQTSPPITVELVPVTDPNNGNDVLTGLGSVTENFQIGKYDVTAEQYCRFLNAVASKSDPYALYNDKMSSDKNVASIDRKGTPESSYTYSVKPGAEKLPIVYVSWFAAARFCNWMHHGQPVGEEGPATTETGAYTLNGAMTDISGTATSPNSDYSKLNAGALYFLPEENQWYKAAYYKRYDADYYNYPTKSDVAPLNKIANVPNSANYFIPTNSDDSKVFPLYWNYQYSNGGKTPFLTPVGAFFSAPGPYGTYDMGGNVFQWTSNPGFTGKRVVRGGSWKHQFNEELHRKTCTTLLPSIGYDFVGFRIAAPAK